MKIILREFASRSIPLTPQSGRGLPPFAAVVGHALETTTGW